jgi:hypothetical protein
MNTQLPTSYNGENTGVISALQDGHHDAIKEEECGNTQEKMEGHILNLETYHTEWAMQLSIIIIINETSGSTKSGGRVHGQLGDFGRECAPGNNNNNNNNNNNFSVRSLCCYFSVLCKSHLMCLA